jgi:hypothetical protein
MLIMLINWAEAYTIKKNTHSLVVDIKENGLEVNTAITVFMILSRDQNARRSQIIKTDNSSSERAEEFRYFGLNQKLTVL